MRIDEEPNQRVQTIALRAQPDPPRWAVKKMSKGFKIVVGVIVITLAAFLFYPVINRNPGLSRDKHEIHAIKMAMNIYYNEYNKYPTGNVESVIAALSGNNPRQIRFIELLTSMNENNTNALDPWGTPYRIEISSNGVAVSCAGPDRKFGTVDDRTTK